MPDPNERIAKLEAALPSLATKVDLGDLRTEMHKEFGAVRAEMQKGFGDLRAEMRDIATATNRWMIGTIVALLLGMVAIYFKPTPAPASAPAWMSAPVVPEPAPRSAAPARPAWERDLDPPAAPLPAPGASR